MLIIDSHEDLAYNMLCFGRDYTRAARETRAHEANGPTPAVNGDTLLGWPDYQRGQVAVVFGTLFATPERAREGEWDTQFYRNQTQAHERYNAQLDAYHRLCDNHPDLFRLIRSSSDLSNVLACWENATTASPAVNVPAPCATGIVVLMEGAEGVRHPNELEEWWQRGVRLIGPAWRGTRFCGGTHEPGPLTPDGFALLEGMAAFGFGLDISHMDVKAALQALDAYPGPIVATHANALALLKGIETNRHLPDSVLQGLIERDGVASVIPYNRFLLPGWRESDSRTLVTLQHVVAHIDYICQMAGDSRHVGLGTDFDGGFGLQSVPAELDTIADLQKLVPLLYEKGYTEVDVANIFSENWRSILLKILS